MKQLAALSRWPGSLEVEWPADWARPTELDDGFGMSRHYLVHSPEELHQLARGFHHVERRRRGKRVSIPGERYTLRHARVDFQRHAADVEAPVWWQDLRAAEAGSRA